MPDPVRVLLVDDHALMRAGFRTVLEAAGGIAVVGEAGTGRDAIAAAWRLRPDVVCMDVQMPDGDGLSATRTLTTDPSVDAAVIVVTTFDHDDYLFEALSAGAAGFLLKNAGPEQLVRAVRVAAAGDALLAPEVTRRVIARFAGGDRAMDAAAGAAGRTGPGASHPGVTSPSATRAAPGRPSAGHPGGGHPGAGTTDVSTAHPGPADGGAPASHRPDLTAREAEVLELMSEALSNAEIARRLFIGEETVKTHVSNVLAKLGARDRVQAVVQAYRLGFAAPA